MRTGCISSCLKDPQRCWKRKKNYVRALFAVKKSYCFIFLKIISVIFKSVFSFNQNKILDRTERKENLSNMFYGLFGITNYCLFKKNVERISDIQKMPKMLFHFFTFHRIDLKNTCTIGLTDWVECL